MFIKKLLLENLFGFPRGYEVDFADFTALVGPNNGGKTSVLRAIKFAFDAFRLYFRDEREPLLQNTSQNQWIIDYSSPGQRLGLTDLSYLFFGRDANRPFSISVTLHDDVELIVSSRENRQISIRLVATNGEMIAGPSSHALVNRVYKTQVQLIPPLGTLSPVEASMPFPAVQEALNVGKYAETWRNQLHWANDGQPPEAFQSVVAKVRSYLPDVQVLPPKRTREHSPPQVTVEFRENAIDYDISAGGGGLRTLLSLAAAIELSGASVILFDEPDSHLHSSLQRQVTRFLVEQTGPEKQIIISTHAPDMIDESPIDSLRWIDRGDAKSRPCDDIGKTLVSLGAVSHTQAIQSIGTDTVLFFEGKPDRSTFESLMARCGKESLLKRSRLSVLGGFGDVTHLPGALRILKTLLPMKVAVAAIKDADYLQLDPRGSIEEKDEVLILTLPCKELENLLLLAPATIANAAKKAAELRANATGETVPPPTDVDVEKKIAELTQTQVVRDSVEHQWLFRYYELKGLRNAGDVTQAQKEFNDRWTNVPWRRRCCPGKVVLSAIRQWLQAEPWKLSITLPQFFAAFEPSSELRSHFDTLEEFVVRTTK